MPNVFVPDAAIAGPVDQNRRGYLPALVCLGGLYFMLGFITCMNDTLVPFFKKGFTLTYAESSLVQFYFFLTYGLFSIPAGKVIEKIGYQNGMICGFLLAATGAFIFFPASVFHTYALFLAALFIIALGIVCMQVAANPYIVILGSAKTAPARLNLIQSVGSVGTIVAPVFGAYFILPKLEVSGTLQPVKQAYIGMAMVLVLISIVVAALKLPRINTEQSLDKNSDTGSSKAKSAFSFRNLNLGAVGIFFVVGIEVAIASFLTNYIAETLHIGVDRANRYVAFYWGGMFIGRLVGVVLLRFIKHTHMLIANSLISVALIITSMNSTGNIAVWALLSVGLFNSVLFGIIFSLATRGLGKYLTQASGILSTAISGGAVIALIQGVLIDRTSWSTAFLIPVICYLYILFYALHGYKSKYIEHP
jgi:FHS family L-fucose permease-like MFS transporter